MECRGNGDLPDAREAGHHRPASTRPEWPGAAKFLTGLDGIFDRALTDSAAGASAGSSVTPAAQGLALILADLWERRASRISGLARQEKPDGPEPDKT